MNASNSNDLPDVAALLKELESSAAWQELKAANAASVPGASSSTSHAQHLPQPEPPIATTGEDVAVQSATSHSVPSSNPGTSVADLLSQLSSTTSHDILPSTSSNIGFNYGPSGSKKAPPPIPSQRTHVHPIAFAEEPKQDRQNFSFRQSLPLLSELGENPAFVASIKKMKTEQDQLERQLWADREATFKKYQEKLKVAQTKAQMIGITVSQHETNMISDAFKKEIIRFDNERVLPAWDGLVSRQQGELARMAVPTMFVTSNVKNRETQQQVINVLENIAGPGRV